jgi:predicted DNA-binding ArsR family transcriptional regulator
MEANGLRAVAVLVFSVILVGCIAPAQVSTTTTTTWEQTTTTEEITTTTEVQQTTTTTVVSLNLSELKAVARSLDELTTAYNGIFNDLNTAKNANSKVLASIYFNSALEKTRALRDSLLEAYVDSTIAKLEAGEDYTQEFFTAFNYVVTAIQGGCVDLSNKVSAGIYAYSAITESNDAFVSKVNKLATIVEDISRMLGSPSTTSMLYYAGTALNKSREFGDASLTSILDSMVGHLEENNLTEFYQDYKAFYVYAVSLEFNACQNLIDAIERAE